MERINKEMETIKQNQINTLELKNDWIKKFKGQFNSRLDLLTERIIELEDVIWNYPVIRAKTKKK